MINITVHTAGLVVAALLIFIIAMPKTLRRDLWLHLRALRCVFARRHRDLREIGRLQKKGFSAIPVEQCHYCTMIVVRESVATRFGAKRVG